MRGATATVVLSLSWFCPSIRTDQSGLLDSFAPLFGISHALREITLPNAVLLDGLITECGPQLQLDGLAF